MDTSNTNTTDWSKNYIYKNKKIMERGGVFISRRMSNDNSLSYDYYVRKAAPCRCGAHNIWLRPFQHNNGSEIGLVCTKCDRLVKGTDLGEAIMKWEAGTYFQTQSELNSDGAP